MSGDVIHVDALPLCVTDEHHLEPGRRCEYSCCCPEAIHLSRAIGVHLEESEVADGHHFSLGSDSSIQEYHHRDRHGVRGEDKPARCLVHYQRRRARLKTECAGARPTVPTRLLRDTLTLDKSAAVEDGSCGVEVHWLQHLASGGNRINEDLARAVGELPGMEEPTHC